MFVLFFDARAPPALYALSLHDALPISGGAFPDPRLGVDPIRRRRSSPGDGTRLRYGRPAGLRRHGLPYRRRVPRSEEHTSELQSRGQLVCRLLLEKKKKQTLTIPRWLA